MQTQDNELPELLVSLFSSPDILNSLRVRRQRVCGETGGVKGTRQQLHCVGAVLACRSGRAGHEALWVEVALVQDDEPGQQQRLVVVMVMVMMQAPSHTSGQQDATFPLVVEHQG